MTCNLEGVPTTLRKIEDLHQPLQTGWTFASPTYLNKTIVKVDHLLSFWNQKHHENQPEWPLGDP